MSSFYPLESKYSFTVVYRVTLTYPHKLLATKNTRNVGDAV